ncbi:sulfur oxidation c-type cytochrome SoxA [Nioella nitratireducens]|uniref:sulfur oxidation c-type cytochrome SoxA n=1 Tax=Nioella nitratireducens TaxID=1287720 RepID=UPI0008FCF4AB
MPGYTRKATLAVLLAGTVMVAPALGDESAELVIDGETLITRAPAPEHMENMSEIMSGWLFRSSETQAVQMDDFDNPGMLYVDEGLDLWNVVEGEAGESCASCHGDAESMAGVRTQMPHVNENGELWAMEDYINNCRTERMGAEAWGWESNEMLSMTTMISYQSRGMPMDVQIDGEAAPYWEQGREMYYTRTGQLNFSCANCHEDNYGNMLRADHLSQGQINGFPVYRLKWAGVGSIHRRLRGCITDTRAETYGRGSDELTALELYVASRGNGLSVEAPSVRN